VLVRGSSGAGKSRLGLGLLAEARARGLFAWLVADDRVLLDAAHGCLIARAPAPLAGLIERWGLGIERLDHEAEAVVRLVVEVSTGHDLQRMPEVEETEIEGVRLPLLRIDGDAGTAPALVLARLLGEGRHPAAQHQA
jgi:HPr kinase/phosphorylase